MREEIQFSAPTAHLPGADMQPKSPGGLCGSAVPWGVQVQVGPEAKISRAGGVQSGKATVQIQSLHLSLSRL